MVSIPVRLFKAARRERVRFHHVYQPEAVESAEPETAPDLPVTRRRSDADELSNVRQISRAAAPPEPEERDAPEPEQSDAPEPVSRVRQNVMSEETGAPLRRESLLKGFETEKGQYVVVRPEEIAALRPKTSSDLQILEFVKLAEIDPIFFDVSYYVVPDPGGEKPMALLVKAMQKTGYVAMGTLAMHGREHAVVLRSGAHGPVLHTLFYNNEVRAGQEWRADSEVGEKELDLATKLIGAMETSFDPAKLKDSFEERLRELIAQRAPAPLTGATGGREKPMAPVVDIMEALKRSLAAARKPVQTASGQHATTKAGRKKRAGG